jgi:hypothetical protein
VLGLSACNAHEELVEPIFEGCATDENWVTLDGYIRAGQISEDPKSGLQWLEPAEGSVLPSRTPAIFRFQSASVAPGNPNGDAICAQFQPSQTSGIRTRHLSPVSGMIFDLQLSVDGVMTYRVLTTRQSASVPVRTWTAWAGKRLSITIYSARLLQNEVIEGPYRAAVHEVQVSL